MNSRGKQDVKVNSEMVGGLKDGTTHIAKKGLAVSVARRRVQDSSPKHVLVPQTGSGRLVVG